MKECTIRSSPRLVCNLENASKQIQNLTCNLLPSNCRVDNLEGREYLVVPMVILTEGVHAGSMGPLYYPKDELSKTPVVWNHKPIVVYHPTMNGESISACDPAIINNRKIGLMMNTRFEKGRLKSEAWLERTRADAVDERIMAAVDSKEMMELSTGVFVDVEAVEGKWKGEDYSGVARNYRPDHLALLPDQIGACSIADGAGFLRNAEGEVSKDYQAAFKKFCLQIGLAGNQMSFSNIESALRTALMEKFNIDPANGPFLWVANVYPTFVIYERDGKFWRLGYTASEVDVTLGNEAPVEVVRVTEYRTMDGAFVGNQNQPESSTEYIMNKKKVIAILMANAVTALGTLTLSANMTDEQLKAINEEQLEAALNDLLKNSKKEEEKKEPTPAAPAANAQAPETPAPTPEPKPAPAANAQPATVQDFIKQAPKEIQEVLNNGLSVYNEEKKKLVEQIMTNKGNGFTKEDLENRPLGELKLIARLAAPVGGTARTANYEGQAPVPASNSGEEEPLEVPVLNFNRN